MQSSSVFLDQWLRSQSTGGATTTPAAARSPAPSQPATARAILQAWAEIRDHHRNHDHHRLLNSLRTLLDSRSSLFVADPQAKLLLSVLSSASSSPLPPESYPLFYRLLYVWVRKSNRPSPSLLESTAQTLATHLSTSISFHGEVALLLGALSSAPTLSAASRRTCLELLCRTLEEGRGAISSSLEVVPEVLGGIGYALSRPSSSPHLRKVVALMLRIWDNEGGLRGTLQHGLMVLNLLEWVVVGLINAMSMESIESLCEDISMGRLAVGTSAQFAVVMSSAGVLRAFWRVASDKGVGLRPKLRNSLEGSISAVSDVLVSRLGKDYNLGGDFETHLLMQCISLALARCGPFPFKSSVILCICLGLLNDIFPLEFFAGRILENPSDEKTSSLCHDLVRAHLNSVLFKEAGAVSGVLCNHYSLANDESAIVVENFLWAYCQDFYSRLRIASLILRQRNKELFQELEKMAESIFFMVVVFASQVSKRKLDRKFSLAIQLDASVRILDAFSCVEYLRRIRWPEYTDVVRRAVTTLQENGPACTSFVQSMPSYNELTSNKDFCFPEEVKYCWLEDEVQTARILFYLRVIPTCIGRIPGPIFGTKVAPTMFLYMCHPNEKVSRAAHSVFVAFMSSGKESDEDGQIKEQLVFYYMQRSLEAFPGVTPYDGMASGVAALVRHLPAGSPAIFYCIDGIIQKAADLFTLTIKDDPDLWRNWEGDSDPCKKILELILHLISLVDIQVLPNLLKLFAQLIVQLPQEGQRIVLNEVYLKVAESDDVIRKPTLVSWLQSLSYLSSQTISSGNSQTSIRISRGGGDRQDTSILCLNRVYSRL